MPNRLLASILIVATFLSITTLMPKAVTAEDAPILIASIFAHTGEAAEENSQNYLMTRLAVKKANEAGGVLGRHVKLIEIDNKSTALGSRQAALEAINAGAVAVVGPSWSSHAMAMAPELQKAKIPMIGATTTAPKVTQVGDFIFRACYTNKSQSIVLAQFARNELKAEKAALMVVAGDVYSEDLADQFTQEFERLGGSEPVRESYLLSSMDFESQLSSIRKSNPDIIFLPGFARDSGLILKQARTMGIQTPFLGGDGWTALEEYKFIEGLTGDNYYVSHWHPDNSNFASQKFLSYIREELGPDALNSIDAGNPVAYDATNLIIDAIRRAGSAAPTDIRDELSKTKDFQGVTGAISYDDSRNPIKPLVVLKIVGSNVYYVNTITPEQ